MSTEEEVPVPAMVLPLGTLEKGEVLVSKIANLTAVRVAKNLLKTQVASNQDVVAVVIVRFDKSYSLKIVLATDVGIETLPTEVNGFPVVIESES